MTRAGGYGYVWHWIFLKRRVGILWYTLTELDRTFDGILSYTKSYVNPPLSSALNLKRKQGTVRPSLHQPPGPVSVRRRSAAQGCADAHTGVRDTSGGWAKSIFLPDHGNTQSQKCANF